MENLLLIEIFNNDIKCICKTKSDNIECSSVIREVLESNLGRINANFLITIYGAFDDKGEVFFEGNILNVDVLDCENRMRKSLIAVSLADLIDKLITIEFESVCREMIPVENYDKIVFEKELFMLMLILIQQLFWYNNIDLDKKVDLSVVTVNGIQKLINNGKGERIMEPITGLYGYKGIEEVSLDNTYLRGINLNNCTTCLNLSSGDYCLSLEVIDTQNRKDTIYIKRNYNEFWRDIKVCLCNDDVYFVLTRELKYND